MAQTVTIRHHYETSPSLVWEIATDLDGLQDAAGTLALYEGLPAGRLYTGQSFDFDISVFGIFPNIRWQVDIEKFDPRNFELLTRERGGRIAQWDAHLVVTPTATGAQLTETITIDAGAMTPAYALLARFVYGRRHKPRLHYLGLAD